MAATPTETKGSSDLRIEDVEKENAPTPALDAHYDPKFVARTMYVPLHTHMSSRCSMLIVTIFTDEK